MNYFLEGLLLGISSIAGCVGICAPMLIPCLLASPGHLTRSLILFLAGRLISYTAFGYVAGMLGIYVAGGLDPRIIGGLNAVFAVWMILVSLGLSSPETGWCRRVAMRFTGALLPFYAGALTGVNVCPPFLLGLSKTLAMKSITGPVIFFMGFYIGSSTWVAPLFVAKKLPAGDYLRNIGRLTALVAGIWFLIQGIVQLIG